MGRKLLSAVPLLVVLLISNHVMAASPQVAASQALLRDATKLRRTIETTCSDRTVARASYQLESTTRLLAEKIERQRCESEISTLMYECIDIYNSLASYVDRDYRLATAPQVVAAMQCTANQINKTVDALRQYRSRPIPPAIPPMPQPSWSTGRVPVAPFQLGQPPVLREHYIPRQPIEPEHAPIQISRQGSYRNYPNSLDHFPNEFHSYHGQPGLGEVGAGRLPQAYPNQQPKIGQMILERVLREALR